MPALNASMTAAEQLAEPLTRTELADGRVLLRGSRRVAQRCGFTMEGTLRSVVVHRGTRWDMWIGALLAGELPADLAG